MLAYLAFAAVAAAADVAGAAIVTRAHKHGHARLRYFVAGGAGFMLAAAFVRMLPESTHVPHAFLFVLLGYFGVHLFEHTVAPHFHFGEEVHREALIRPSAGWLAVFGLGVHTVFDGVAIAAGFMVSSALGAILFIAVMLHKLPEGFTIASIMLAGGHSRGAALAAGIGLGVLTLAGAVGTSFIAQQHIAYALALFMSIAQESDSERTELVSFGSLAPGPFNSEQDRRREWTDNWRTFIASVRINWIITDWFRTEAYYSSGGWRATWRGEGGGVLLNQCLHNLDVMAWLFGLPARVRGFCQLGRYHNIEVEDNVTAYLEYPNGATGVFITSTGEAPGTNRFEIAGTRGKLVLERDKLSFTRNDADMIEFSKTSKVGFAKPEVWHVDVPFDNASNPHAILVQNFVNAILKGEKLIAPGEEGIHSVELANVMLYSSLIGQTVELPMDSAAFEKKLKQLIAESKFEKKVVEITSDDFTKSFNR